MKTNLILTADTAQAVKDNEGHWLPKSLLEVVSGYKFQDMRSKEELTAVWVEMPDWLARKHGLIAISPEIYKADVESGEIIEVELTELVIN